MQTKIINCLCISSLTLLVLPQLPSLGQSFLRVAEPTQINQLSTPQTLVIPPLSASEILPAVKSESVGDAQELLSPPGFNTFITRDFPNFWQMRVPTDQVGFLYATYEMKAENGRNNAVSNAQNSNSAVQVVLEPLPITEISRDQNSNTALVQGGFQLKMDLSTAQSAGLYGGNVAVTVNRR
ncbi:MAG: hypothetical protein V7K32_24990 [Nostoc sp.]|uniref:hypothetical protein n=1 Tax=Nostoc sp. TaxID=1180 RepID=UPI002FF8E482